MFETAASTSFLRLVPVFEPNLNSDNWGMFLSHDLQSAPPRHTRRSLKKPYSICTLLSANLTKRGQGKFIAGGDALTLAMN